MSIDQDLLKRINYVSRPLHKLVVYGFSIFINSSLCLLLIIMVLFGDSITTKIVSIVFLFALILVIDYSIFRHINNSHFPDIIDIYSDRIVFTFMDDRIRKPFIMKYSDVTSLVPSQKIMDNNGNWFFITDLVAEDYILLENLVRSENDIIKGHSSIFKYRGRIIKMTIILSIIWFITTGFFSIILSYVKYDTFALISGLIMFAFSEYLMILFIIKHIIETEIIINDDSIIVIFGNKVKISQKWSNIKEVVLITNNSGIATEIIIKNEKGKYFFINKYIIPKEEKLEMQRIVISKVKKNNIILKKNIK